MLQPQTIGRIVMKLLPKLQNRKTRPMFIIAADNFPLPGQKRTNKEDVFRFLKYFYTILKINIIQMSMIRKKNVYATQGQ